MPPTLVFGGIDCYVAESRYIVSLGENSVA